MSALDSLTKKLQSFINMEHIKSHEEIAGYIAGELIGDYNNLHSELLLTNSDVRYVAELASDLEWSNDSKDELVAMWNKLKDSIAKLDNA